MAERYEKKKPIKNKWRIWSWITFLVGLPAWMIIFFIERNWIAAALEAASIPSVALGLIIAVRGEGKKPQWLNALALITIIVGITYSLYDLGGFTRLTQLYELAMTVGLLVGTYQLAHENASGYVWYVLMHVAAILLLGAQGYPWLVAQQVVSLFFVADAYFVKKSIQKNKAV